MSEQAERGSTGPPGGKRARRPRRRLWPRRFMRARPHMSLLLTLATLAGTVTAVYLIFPAATTS